MNQSRTIRSVLSILFALALVCVSASGWILSVSAEADERLTLKINGIEMNKKAPVVLKMIQNDRARYEKSGQNPFGICPQFSQNEAIQEFECQNTKKRALASMEKPYTFLTPREPKNLGKT